MEMTQWEALSPAEKKKALFFEQKKLLDTFLEHNAITRAQYEKSLGDIKTKMGMENCVECDSR